LQWNAQEIDAVRCGVQGVTWMKKRRFVGRADQQTDIVHPRNIGVNDRVQATDSLHLHRAHFDDLSGHQTPHTSW